MARYGQRTSERRHWVRFAWIGEAGGAFRVSDKEHAGMLRAEEVNAACNTTIVISRMLRKGQSAWRVEQINKATRRRMG